MNIASETSHREGQQHTSLSGLPNQKSQHSQEPSSLSHQSARKCSICGGLKHNARTCLEQQRVSGGGISDAQPSISAAQVSGRDEDHDSDFSGTTRDSRKKGIAWSEEEHRQFLIGLQKIGKGDWRGISRQFVQTRSPTQVASHAQKYFIRQSVAGKRKRRSSLFDLVPDGPAGSKSRTAGPPAEQGAADVKPEPSAPKPDGQLAFPFSGMPQGPEAFAMACWYQNMLMQQGPMAWMQAMCNQQQQGHPSMFSPPDQGMSMPSLPPLPPPGFPFMGPGQEQGGQMSAQQQAMMMMAHQQQQQQLAAAYAMGSIHSFASSMGAAQDAAKGNTTPSLPHPDRPKAIEQPEKSEQESYAAYAPKDSLPAPEDRQHSSSRDSVSLGMNSQEPPPERFGNGMLIRPKAQKAFPPQLHELGGLPSYMTARPPTTAAVPPPNPSSSVATSSEGFLSGQLEGLQQRISAIPTETSGSTACGFTASSGTCFRGMTPGGSEASRKVSPSRAEQQSPEGTE